MLDVLHATCDLVVRFYFLLIYSGMPGGHMIELFAWTLYALGAFFILEAFTDVIDSE